MKQSYFTKSRVRSDLHLPLSRALLILTLLSSCNDKLKLFTLLPPSETGVGFVNQLNSTDSLNILHYLYFYNGGGVAIGDINNDGLADIYFTSNQGSNKLYLNKGNFRFLDITSRAGVEGKGNWKTGVTMADVNADGLLDIYVCEVGNYKNLKGRNELFINNGNETFTERAADFGLNIEGFNTQASFFDYDRDGDLDMFLVNHSVHSTDTYNDASIRSRPADASGDKLFRNDMAGNKKGFTEVTEEAGIYSSAIGYGLNVMIADFNNDHWDDIYVSNDFHENDYYYLNNKNGSFREMNQQAFGHESRFSMGSDAGDINNDGWLDLVTLDMLPADEKLLKSAVTDDPLDIHRWKLNHGYHDQYSRNCLQLNVNKGEKFSDIGLYAGVAATDWSWSPLLADFNNDGIKDLFITNGISKRPNDLDYLKFISSPSIRAALERGQSGDSVAIEKMPAGQVSNYIFQGTSQLKFLDQTAEWGMDIPTLSNGAAYADLDNDGDLDLVVNNVNTAASIYRNNSNAMNKNHYLSIQLVGTTPNFLGYGAKVLIRHDAQVQLSYITASRGFQSASTPVVHFGLGDQLVIDTVQVIWPDEKVQTFTNVATDQRLLVNQKDAAPAVLPSRVIRSEELLFRDITGRVNLSYKHNENDYVDFNFQPLIPHQASTRGPKIAVADINKDGLDDFFVCGAKGQPGQLFQQTKTGGFEPRKQPVFIDDALSEDVNAIFFDADNDGDSDLYVVSGGNEFFVSAASLSDRIYLNDGQGNFEKGDLPSMPENKSVAAAADVDRDGDLDLFIGGAAVTGSYGAITNSYLLINDGKGKFTIAQEGIATGLRLAGMVTDAVWTDIDKDGWVDLVMVGEWMPVTVYKNMKGKLVNKTKELKLDNTTGLWTTVHAADVDGDGYTDLLVGNRGENSKLSASDAYPLKLYIGDLDQNGRTDQILAVHKGNKYYSFLGKEELEKQLPVIRKKYPDYTGMAGQSVEQIFGDKLSRCTVLTVNTLSSILLKNEGGSFLRSNLPREVQWSTTFAFITADFNRDGMTDILSAGNFFGVTPYEGKYDAGFGNVLLGGHRSFRSLFPAQSGFSPGGEVRDIKRLRTVNNSACYIIARNNDTMLFYENN